MRTPRPATARPVRLVTPGVVVLLLASAFFFWVWYERYLSLDFNELGLYYDAQTQTVTTDAGFVWVLPAVLCLALAAGKTASRAWRRRAAEAPPPSRP